MIAMKENLKLILRNLLTDAYAAKGVERKKTLEKGLTIRVMVSHSRVILMLQRNNVLPSMDEWLTVLKYWPWPLPKSMPQPQERHHGMAHGLTATWNLLPDEYQPQLETAAEEVGA
jgi:hypothetical protein